MMTMKEFETLKKTEAAKIEALEKIIKILDELKKAADDEAVEWVMEKINE